MGEGHSYLLKDRYTFLGEEMENVYLFSQIEGGGDAHEVADMFEVKLLSLIREFQHANAVHHSLVVINQTVPTDFHTQVLTVDNAGILTGETLPRFNAWGFRKNRASTAWRNGAIRIGGVAEGSQDGGIANSGALEDLQTFAAVAGSRIEDGLGNSYDLTIASKPTTPGQPYVPRALSTVQYVRLTTQNSRKR